MEKPDLYVNLGLLPGTQIKIDQYHVFTITCCSNPDSGGGIPMSLDYFLKLVFKIKPYIISVTTSDPNVRDVLLGYIPESKIVYTGSVRGDIVGGTVGGDTVGGGLEEGKDTRWEGKGDGGNTDFSTGGGESSGKSNDGKVFGGIGIR